MVPGLRVHLASVRLSFLVVVTLTSILEGSTWVSPVRDLVNKAELVGEVTDIYITSERRRLENIRSMIAERRERLSMVKAQEGLSVQAARTEEVDQGETDQYLAHPLNSFNLIRSWSDIRSTCNTNNAYYKDMAAVLRRKDVRLPDVQTRSFTMKNILRAQLLYNVSADDIVATNISGHTSVFKLGSDDMAEVAYLAQEFRQFLLSAEWLAHAVIRHDDDTVTNRDGMIDSLVGALTVLTNEKALYPSVLLEVERWIYVHNRDESRLRHVLEDLLHILRATERSKELTAADRSYKPCPRPQDLINQYRSVQNDDLNVLDLLLTDAQIQDIEDFHSYLWQLSFIVEGMRTRVWPEVLDIAHSAYVDATMAMVLEAIEKFCPSCDVGNVIETQSFSLRTLYDSGGYPGLDFVLETSEFRESKNERIAGVHVVLFASDSAHGAVIPVPGGSAVIPVKGRGLVWRTRDMPYTEQAPVWCPVLFGERRLLHIFVRTS